MASAADVDGETVRPETLHLGCGEDYQPGMCNVDANPDVDPDRVVDLEETPWPFAADEFGHIVANHVVEHLADPAATLQEMARVGRPGARIEIRTPIGLDHRADPDHTTEWVYDTPDVLLDDHWHDVDGLRIADRDLELWSHWSGYVGVVVEWVVERYRRRHGADRELWDIPGVSGEYTLILEVTADA